MRATVCLIAVVVGLGSPGLIAQTAVQVTVISGTSGVATTTTGTATTTAGIASGTVAPTPVFVVTPPAVAPRLDPPGDLRITNLSTRAKVTPSNPLVAGFAISGTTARTVLVRAVGPALGGFGVVSVAEAVRLRLHDTGGAVVAENAGWSSAPLVPDAIATTGAFPFAAGSADAALVVTLRPGNYSAEVIAADGVGGVALVEVYDVDGLADGSRLRNVSTMGTVATGSDVISGFVLAGTGTRQYLIRGVGPGLTKLGVAGVLKDPTFTLFNSAGTQLAANDDWSGYAKPGVVAIAVASTSVAGTTSVVPTITRDLVSLATQLTGAFPLDLGSTDAALVATLGPGAYTVQVRGVGTTVITTTPASTTTVPAPTASTAPTDSVAAVAAVAAAATAQAVQAISVSSVPPAPGIALLEVYELP